VVTASPESFTLEPGQTQAIAFTAAPNGDVTAAIAFGNVILHEAAGQSPDQHITAAVKGTGPEVDDTIFKDGFDVDNGGQTCDPVQLFQDTSFEATDPGTFINPFWSNDDSVAGSSFCDASCDSGGVVVAHTGDWFVWFGGYQEANTSSLSQDVVFPSSQPRWLNYWLIDQIAGDPTSSFTLSIDGDQVLDIAGGTVSQDYAAQTFEVPAQYLDGQSHTVRFDWSADSAAGEIGGAMVDDVTLDCTAQSPRPASPSGNLTAALRKHVR
jgi:hypothetical protein